MAYEVIDKRGKEPPKECCRVCGSPEVHSRNYNEPTMKCIEYLRKCMKPKESNLGAGCSSCQHYVFYRKLVGDEPLQCDGDIPCLHCLRYNKFSDQFVSKI